MRWSLLFLSALVGPGALAAGTPERPNVIFLLADDMRTDTIAALGNPVAGRRTSTPSSVAGSR